MAEHKTPAPELVNEVLRRIPTPSLRRAFFQGLKNPTWVEPLASAGMFDNPPEPEKTGNGLIADHYWPEIDYLIRVAPETPRAVVDVLLKLSGSNNAWVRRAVFTIGASIPAAEAARLKPMVKSWSEAGFGWRIDPRDMVGFAANLLQGGQSKAGKWMANFLFRPTESENHRPALTLDDYWYHDGLPRVVKALGDDGLKTVLPWLEEYERQSKRFTDTFDMTDISRESIRVRSDHYPSIEHSLIDAVRDLAFAAMVRNPRTAAATLAKSPMNLARKITLYATTEALRHSRAHPGTKTDELLAVATDLIADLVADKSYRADSCRIEFGELAREVAPLAPFALTQFAEFVAAGPLSKEQLQERLRFGEDESPEDLTKRIDDVVDTWKHRWLSAVGNEALPAALGTVLEELDAKRGVIDSPLAALNTVTGWTGPNSPISQDEMSVMSPVELVAHLSSWHDTGDRWGPRPSHEGQGRELSSLITTNPRAFDGIADLVDKLRPTYLRATIQGWDAAVKAGIALDWDHAANLIHDVLTHSDASQFPQEGGNFDDDADFVSTKGAAVDLLEELVQKRETPVLPSEAQLRFADLLIAETDNESAWEDYAARDSDSGMDPLTLSLNWQWPTRVRGLLNLVLHGGETAWYANARSALERELERVDEQGASRAVVGRELGRLLNVDPDWIRPRIAELFGSADSMSSSQQIALTTAMAIHYYHPKLYDVLAPAMVAAIRSPEPLIAGWQGQSEPMQRIGEWVVDSIIRGHKTPEDVVSQAFFSAAEPKVRGAAVGRIAWSFMHAESVDDDIRDRFADLWDARVRHVRDQPADKHELNEFYWFVRSEKFEIAWWLPRLREAIELNPDLAGERFMLGKHVAGSADVDPRGALEATKALLRNREGLGMPAWDLTRNAVPMVIARAMISGDEQLKRDAVVFMNELGEHGNQNLEKEVREVLDGKTTQDDVSD